MNGLDSPLEINPINLVVPLFSSTINNLWTLLAILTATAAFSLWRLRVPLSLSSPQHPPTKIHHQEAPVLDVEEKEKEKDKDIILTSGNRSNSSKELYTVFYDNEDVEREENDRDEDDVDGGDEEVVREWGDDDDEEELTVEMRGAGDLGWYGYQDRRVINGSVVRLWEQEQRSCSTTSPRNYRHRVKRSLTL